MKPIRSTHLKDNVLTLYRQDYSFTDYHKDGEGWRRAPSMKKIKDEELMIVQAHYQSKVESQNRRGRGRSRTF